MLRRVFALISILSLLLCAMTVALWVRGRSVEDTFYFRAGNGCWVLASDADSSAVLWYRRWPPQSFFHHTSSRRGKMPPSPAFSMIDPNAGAEWRWWKLSAGKGRWSVVVTEDGVVNWNSSFFDLLADKPELRFSNPMRVWWVKFPAWFVPVISAAVTGIAALRLAFRTLRRIALPGIGRCASCGYDLRATPDRCPECGAPARSPATS